MCLVRGGKYATAATTRVKYMVPRNARKFDELEQKLNRLLSSMLPVAMVDTVDLKYIGPSRAGEDLAALGGEEDHLVRADEAAGAPRCEAGGGAGLVPDEGSPPDTEGLLEGCLTIISKAIRITKHENDTPRAKKAEAFAKDRRADLIRVLRRVIVEVAFVMLSLAGNLRDGPVLVCTDTVRRIHNDRIEGAGVQRSAD